MSKLSLSGPRWSALCVTIKDRDGWACTKCGSTSDLTVDHIIALDSMADDEREDLAWNPDNLQTLCRTCNGRKSNRVDDGRKTWFHPDWFESGFSVSGW